MGRGTLCAELLRKSRFSVIIAVTDGILSREDRGQNHTVKIGRPSTRRGTGRRVRMRPPPPPLSRRCDCARRSSHLSRGQRRQRARGGTHTRPPPSARAYSSVCATVRRRAPRLYPYPETEVFTRLDARWNLSSSSSSSSRVFVVIFFSCSSSV